MKLPTLIDPSPLVEAVADVRFEPAIPAAAVFGYIYEDLVKDRYGDLVTLPVLQVPEEIREKDPNFKFQPHYRMASSSLVLALGPRIFNLSALDQGYPGWSLFRKEIQAIFDILLAKNVITKIYRIGMRYINFFEGNVFQFSNFSVSLGDSSLMDENTLLRVQFSEDILTTAVQIANEADLNTSSGMKSGSVMDLDTFCLDPVLTEKSSKAFGDLIEKTHGTLKERFFRGLKEEFIASLSPQYK